MAQPGSGGSRNENRPWPGLRAGPFGMVLASVFGEGSRLAMAPAVGLVELGLEGGASGSVTPPAAPGKPRSASSRRQPDRGSGR